MISLPDRRTRRKRRSVCIAYMARMSLWAMRRHRDEPQPRWNAMEPWSPMR